MNDFHLTDGRSQQLFTFEPAKACYIKLDIATVGGDIDDVNVGWGVSLTELEVYRVTDIVIADTGESNNSVFCVAFVVSIAVMLGCVLYNKKYGFSATNR